MVSGFMPRDVAMDVGMDDKKLMPWTNCFDTVSDGAGLRYSCPSGHLLLVLSKMFVFYLPQKLCITD